MSLIINNINFLMLNKRKIKVRCSSKKKKNARCYMIVDCGMIDFRKQGNSPLVKLHLWWGADVILQYRAS